MGVVHCLTALVRDKTFLNLLDADKDVLSVTDGVVDLRTATLRPRVRGDYLIYALSTPFDPEHPELHTIEKWMKDVTLSERLGRPEYLEFMQRLIGYSITGHTREEIIVMFIGNGANSKGVLHELLSDVLESLYYAAPRSIIVQTARGGAGAASSDMAALNGKRIGAVDEMPDEPLNDTQFRLLAGGAGIPARELYSAQASFKNLCQIILNFNFPVQMRITHATLRRIMACPFDMQALPVVPMSGAALDPTNPRHILLDIKMKGNLSRAAFFSWAVAGAKKWYEEGLGPHPKCCADLRSHIMDDNADVGMWIAERCEVGEGLMASTKMAWNDFCASRPEGNNITNASFRVEMGRRGFHIAQATRTQLRDKRCCHGLKIAGHIYDQNAAV
ncbi:hypothetical protein JKP88DRAFT_164087 [Tribonema minus]|uniref:Bacteriophage/plasmid primase P4 C-terminal domain-containing protein n=1 Tax=Tribonema minus TaxID=303371 RepID=A0A835Z1L1_9STRA|nr:hypothetical protein JKP88DRAFT_164087 [Tribonema minus]